MRCLATPQRTRISLAIILVLAHSILGLDLKRAVGELRLPQLGERLVGGGLGDRDRVHLALRGSPIRHGEEEPFHPVEEVGIVRYPVPAVLEDDVEGLGRAGLLFVALAFAWLVSPWCDVGVRDTVATLEEF